MKEINEILDKLKLDKNILFIKCWEPFDYRNMGQLAIQLTYTCGDTQMLTTKTTKDNVFASFDFESHDDFYLFVNYLKNNNIPRKF